MDTKLTLKLDENIIDRAKRYAKQHEISLSGLIENYLKKITKEDKEELKITPLVKSLSGVLTIPEENDHRNGYANFLTDKYK